MGLKKKLSGIAEAVEGILGDPVKAKKLKKTKALERFVEKMEAKRVEISDELKSDGLEDGDRTLKKRHLETLDKQISKAKKLLADKKD